MYKRYREVTEDLGVETMEVENLNEIIPFRFPALSRNRDKTMAYLKEKITRRGAFSSPCICNLYLRNIPNEV